MAALYMMVFPLYSGTLIYGFQKYKLDNDVHGVVLCITLFTPIAKPHPLAIDILAMIRLPEKKAKNGKSPS
jgi:hypothetical protein